MGKIAIVFSGQGAQYPGMGKTLYENCEAAKKLYDFAESIRPGTKEQCFNGSAEELKITKNTQPCLYLVDLCAALALKELGVSADGVAGFSLGEIAALAYAGAYSYEDGFKIVCQRADFMQNASEKHKTAMAAIVKLTSEQVENLCDRENEIYPVNYNSPLQTVVAGACEAIDAFGAKVKEAGGRAIALPVSAAFHSPYMDEAAQNFKDYLLKQSFTEPKIDVYSNYTAKPYSADVLAELSKQINNPVRWCETITNMVNDGYTDFIEAGAGKTLCGLIKKIAPNANVYSAEDYESVKNSSEAVKNNA